MPAGYGLQRRARPEPLLRRIRGRREVDISNESCVEHVSKLKNGDKFAKKLNRTCPQKVSSSDADENSEHRMFRVENNGRKRELSDSDSPLSSLSSDQLTDELQSSSYDAVSVAMSVMRKSLQRKKKKRRMKGESSSSELTKNTTSEKGSNESKCKTSGLSMKLNSARFRPVPSHVFASPTSKLVLMSKDGPKFRTVYVEERKQTAPLPKFNGKAFRTLPPLQFDVEKSKTTSELDQRPKFRSSFLSGASLKGIFIKQDLAENNSKDGYSSHSFSQFKSSVEVPGSDSSPLSSVPSSVSDEEEPALLQNISPDSLRFSSQQSLTKSRKSTQRFSSQRQESNRNANQLNGINKKSVKSNLIDCPICGTNISRRTIRAFVKNHEPFKFIECEPDYLANLASSQSQSLSQSQNRLTYKKAKSKNNGESLSQELTNCLPFRLQSILHRSHLRATGLEEYMRKGYPRVDWRSLPRRIKRFEHHLARVVGRASIDCPFRDEFVNRILVSSHGNSNKCNTHITDEPTNVSSRHKSLSVVSLSESDCESEPVLLASSPPPSNIGNCEKSRRSFINPYLPNALLSSMSDGADSVLSRMIPGYYGPRGARIMTEIISRLPHVSAMLRQMAALPPLSKPSAAKCASFPSSSSSESSTKYPLSSPLASLQSSFLESSPSNEDSTLAQREFEQKMQRILAMAGAGDIVFIQAVLVPETASRLIVEDLAVDIQTARRVVTESVQLGELVNWESDADVFSGDDDFL